MFTNLERDFGSIFKELLSMRDWTNGKTNCGVHRQKILKSKTNFVEQILSRSSVLTLMKCLLIK